MNARVRTASRVALTALLWSFRARAEDPGASPSNPPPTPPVSPAPTGAAPAPGAPPPASSAPPGAAPAPARGTPPAYPPAYPPPGYPPGYYPPPGYSAYPAPWYGQPGYGYGYPPPYGQGPPPRYESGPPPPDPTVHLHDSFYLRMSLGAGYTSAVQSFAPGAVPLNNGVTQVTSTADVSVHGSGPSFDFMFGGTPVNGLVLGGGLMFNVAPSPDVKVLDVSATSQSDFTFWMATMFLDIYPKPTGGFHLGALAGIAEVEWSGGGSGSSGTGFGGGVLAGYDAWVGKQWSLGGMLRLLGASASHDTLDGTTKFATLNVAVLGTALYQ